MLTHTTEIAAPASVLREVLLDFDHLKEWHTAWFLDLKTTDPCKKAIDLQKGDILAVSLGNGNFNPVVQVNTPTKFAWLGGITGILNGLHVFEFLPSLEYPDSPNHSRFVQSEEFTGILWFVFAYPSMFMGKPTLAGFTALNYDLKKRAEQVWAERQLSGGN